MSHIGGQHYGNWYPKYCDCEKDETFWMQWHQEYIGIKIKRINKESGITQPVLLQCLRNEFELPDGKAPSMPAKPGTILIKQAFEDFIIRWTYQPQVLGYYNT